jgi:flagellar protein FlaG
MNTINSQQIASNGVQMAQGNNQGGATSVVKKNDSEVVSQAVVSANIKSVNLDEVTQPSREVVAKAAAQLQSFVQSMGRNLNFSIDESSGYHVVRVVNPDTGELIRQLPSEELLKISRDFQRLNIGLVSQRA